MDWGGKGEAQGGELFGVVPDNDLVILDHCISTERADGPCLLEIWDSCLLRQGRCSWLDRASLRRRYQH